MTYVNPELKSKFLKNNHTKTIHKTDSNIKRKNNTKTLVSKRINFKVNRINRRSYIISIILSYVFVLFGSFLDGVLYVLLDKDIEANELGSPLVLLTLLISAAFIIQASIMRLHDIDRKGWELIIAMIPLVGLFVALPMLFQKGTAGKNRFGMPIEGIYILWITKEKKFIVSHDESLIAGDKGYVRKTDEEFDILESDQKDAWEKHTNRRLYGNKKYKQKKWYIIAGSLILAFFLAQPVIDLSHYIVGSNFADERIQEIANGAGFNYRGKVLFFKTNPELVNADTLNTYCPNDNQNVVEYGCYDPVANKIYLLKVDDSGFEEIEYNVAAHETLHAAFVELGYDEYVSLKTELDRLYNSETSGMQSIKDALQPYEQDGATITNELHSFIGANLHTRETSVYLNDYYEKYFNSRNNAVNAKESFDNKIADWSSRLGAESAALDRIKAELAAYKIEWLDKIEGYIESNIYYGDERRYYQNMEAYENNRNIYNRKVDEFNARLDRYNLDVAEYNSFLRSFKPGFVQIKQKSL